jgi:hypothetical protein
MKECLKAFAHKLTDCFVALAKTEPKVLISFTVGMTKGYLKAFAYGLCHSVKHHIMFLKDNFIGKFKAEKVEIIFSFLPLYKSKRKYSTY